MNSSYYMNKYIYINNLKFYNVSIPIGSFSMLIIILKKLSVTTQDVHILKYNVKITHIGKKNCRKWPKYCTSSFKSELDVS